jgi:dephospho-CoA kinase
MLTLKKVAVTGSLACGKSSVCRFFKELGAHVVSADAIVHELLNPNTVIGKEIINLFGTTILTNDQFDRNKIAQKVFGDPLSLKKLENILHPEVDKAIEKEYKECKSKGVSPLFIAEVPLLFETGKEKNFDSSISVLTPLSLCRQRFSSSTGCDDKEYEKRMTHQLPAEAKAKKANFVILNEGDFKNLQYETENLFHLLTKN